MKNKPKRLSPAQRTSQRMTNAMRRASDQEMYERALPPDQRAALEKQRYSQSEAVSAFGGEASAAMNARGINYNINSADDIYAIYPDSEDPAYNSAGFNTGYYESPTSTTNADRPRTVAASYDPDRSVLTIMFRDSTLYNYYNVDLDTWNDFHTSNSKGPYIRDVLDSHPRGPANLSDLNPGIRSTAYVLARSLQSAKGATP